MCVEMCMCDNCRVPARAKTRGTYSVTCGFSPTISTSGAGRAGSRQAKGASEWM